MHLKTIFVFLLLIFSFLTSAEVVDGGVRVAETANSVDAKIDVEDIEKTRKTINFGTAAEITSLITKLNDGDDVRFNDDLENLFKTTKSNDVKGKILDYFAKQEDARLSDYAVEILSDPYDLPTSLVEKCFNYVSSVKCSEAAPELVKILDGGDEKYFNAALTALGKTGGAEEAKYLSEYLNRDDLTVAQRQALMRTLGNIGAEETWDDLCKIAQDEDENAFVRMYASEAIGKMKKAESVPILVEIFEGAEPNLRQYCIKGLSYFPDSEEAKNTILQAIRDDHYKVRIEAINAAKSLEIKEAVPFLIYRAKNDSENAVKKECFSVIAKLDTADGNEFLIDELKDKKTSDAVKYQIAQVLMEKGTVGEKEILSLAKEALKDDRRKPLRQNLGKLFIKYSRPDYSEICSLYLQSKDAIAQSQGLELYKKAKYETARPAVKDITENKKANNANKEKAKNLLGIEDEDEDEKSNKKTDEAETKTSKTKTSEVPISTGDAK